MERDMVIGIGIVGFASYYSHYFADRAVDRPDCAVVGAARPATTDATLSALGRPTAEEFSDAHDCPVYDTLEEISANSDVDAVVLGTPTSRRADDAVAILENGHPVLTGKPVSDSAAGAARIAETSRATGTLAATTAPHRFDGRIEEARRRVDDGGVGEVLRVRTSAIHRRAGEDDIAGHDTYAPGEAGAAYAMGYYTADLLRWFVGDRTPERLTGELQNANTPYMPHPDLGSATVRYADGTIGTMTIAMANDHGPGAGWEVEVVGTEGTIRIDHSGYEGHHWRGDGTEAFGRSLDPVLDTQFDAFVEALGTEEGTASIEPTPPTVRDGMALIDAWEAAAETGGPVDVD